MPVLYGSYAIRPAPVVTFKRQNRDLGDGRKISSIISATLTGKIIPGVVNGVLTPIATASRMSSIIESQVALRQAFSQDGLLFQVQGWDAGTPVKFPARVIDVDFSDGPWVDYCDYTITLEGPLVSGETDGNQLIESSTESWGFEEGDTLNTRKVTHNLQAKGMTTYDGNGGILAYAWQNAKTFIANCLGLGWTTEVGVWSPNSGLDFAEQSENDPPSTTPYNHVITNTIDETEGTYSLVESWVLSPNSYIEEYTIAVRKVEDQPRVGIVASINGNIKGLYVTQNDYATRYANAVAGWATVQSLLLTRANASSGASLNTHPSATQSDFDAINGVVSYTYEFNNRAIVNDTFEVFEVSQKSSIQEYYSHATVQGVITGMFYPDTDSDPTIKLTRATYQWGNVVGLLYARAVAATGLTDLNPFPEVASSEPNMAQGTISYAYEFTNRTPTNVIDDFDVNFEYSRETGITTIKIQGTITGLRQASPSTPYVNSSSEQIATALAYYEGKAPQMLSIATIYFPTANINPNPMVKSASVNPFKMTVGYSWEFNSLAPPCVPGALTESTTITNMATVPEYAFIPIPGKANGPIFQNLATVKPMQRTVVCELVFPPATNACVLGNGMYVDLSQYAPTGSQVALTNDQTDWNPRTGRLIRNISWTYTA